MKPARAHLEQLINSHRVETILLLAVLTYTAVFTYATYQKHYTFSSYAWDLGVFNQLLHDTLFEGKPFYYTPDVYFNTSGSYLVIHFSPILFLLLPLYYILPGVTTLLCVKTLLLATAAIPLYLLSNQLVNDKKISLYISLAYLLYPGLQGANWFDFQQQAFIPLLLFTALYLFTKERWTPYAVTILLAFTVFELSFAIVIISLLCLQAYTSPKELLTQLRQFKPNKVHVTILTTLFGVVYYYAAKWFMSGYSINPLFRQQYLASSVFNIVQYSGDTIMLPAYIITHLPDVLQALSYDPALKLLYIIFLFGPLLFLPLTTRSLIPLLLLFSPFLLSNYQAYYMIGSHYPLYLIAPIFTSLILVYANHFHEERRNIAKKMLAITILFATILSPISPISDTLNAKTAILWYPPYTGVTERVDEIHTLIAEVPPSASILTQNHIFPHFSDRINAYVLPTLPPSGDQERYLKNYIDELMDKSDYILLDLRTYDASTSYVFEKALSPGSGHRIATYIDSAVLITKKEVNATTIAASYPRIYTINSGLHVGKGVAIQDPTSRSGEVAESTPGTRDGHLVYGPYEFMDEGTYRLTFSIKTSQTYEGYLGTFDAYDSGGQITKRDVYGYEVTPGEWTNFTVTLTLKQAKAAVEYRFEATDLAKVRFDYVRVEAQTTPLPESTRSIDAKDLNVADSRVTADQLIVVTANGPQPIEAAWFGPYITLPAGNYTVTYHLKPAKLTQDTQTHHTLRRHRHTGRKTDNHRRMGHDHERATTRRRMVHSHPPPTAHAGDRARVQGKQAPTRLEHHTQPDNHPTTALNHPKVLTTQKRSLLSVFMARTKDPWERPATKPNEYHCVQAQRGREFIVRMTTGTDVFKALQQFAKDKKIRFGKIHAAFMGGFAPAKMYMWTPDNKNRANWHNETAASFENLSMLISMSGMIHTRIVDGKAEPFPAIHYCVGGAWDVPTVGGHLTEGTIVRGVVEVFVTEILGIDELLPSNYDPSIDGAPEEWYKETK